MISKDGRPIRTLDEWREFAGPKSAGQWKDGRSAKEAARVWLGEDPSTLPSEIAALLSSHADFGLTRRWAAEPEARVPFDSFRGEPPNIDILAKVEDAKGSAVLVVEAKADETFGSTLERTLSAAGARLKLNPRSNGVARLKNLARLVLGVVPGLLSTVGHIRYQLLTATAAAVFEARRDGVARALVLVEEFVTDQSDDRKHTANATDLRDFVELLGGSEVSSGTIQGPFHIEDVSLYVGKVVHHLRGQVA